MAEFLKVFKCEICGNIVEVLHEGIGELVCCGKPMVLLEEHTKDEGLEKHVPVVEKTEEGILVKVGSVPHPMEEKHYIEWVSVLSGGKIFRKFLKPGDKPEAHFCVSSENLENIEVKEYCNVHGLWKK